MKRILIVQTVSTIWKTYIASHCAIIILAPQVHLEHGFRGLEEYQDLYCPVIQR